MSLFLVFEKRNADFLRGIRGAILKESLRKLQTEYIDLALIQQPFNDYYGTWRTMEEAYKEGWIRAIGVSNFYPDRLADLCSFVDVKPAVNQVETHVFQQRAQAHEYMVKYGVQHESWGHLPRGGRTSLPILS